VPSESRLKRYVLLTDGYPPLQQGGAEKMAWLAALQADAAGYEVHVITGADRPQPDRIQDNVTVHTVAARIPERWIGWLGLYNPGAIRSVKRLLHQLSPDVVAVHNVHHRLSWWCLRIASKAANMVTFTAHDLLGVTYGKMTHFCVPGARPPFTDAQLCLPRFHDLRLMRFRYNPWRRPIIRALLRSVNQRFAVSDLQRRALEANGLPAFTVRHNRIDVQIDRSGFEVDTAAIEAFKTLHGLHHRRVVLFGGRISREKGSEQMLEAFARVQQQVPDALLLVLMQGTLAVVPQYQALVEQGHIQVAGWLHGTELAVAYHAALCVCVPSVYLDPFPTVVLEAVVAKVPVLVSHFSGGIEAIQEGVTGYSIDPFDAEAFAARIISVLGTTTGLTINS